MNESIKKRNGMILLLKGDELIQYTGEGSSGGGVVSVSLLTLSVFAVVLVLLRK